MTLTVRPRRLVLFAASTAFAAAGVLVPTTAFAAPASPHTAVTDNHQDRSRDDHSDKWGKEEHKKWDHDTWGKEQHDKWDHDKHDKHEKHEKHDKWNKWDHDTWGKGKGKVKHVPSEWQCFAAPCVPPSWLR